MEVCHEKGHMKTVAKSSDAPMSEKAAAWHIILGIPLMILLGPWQKGDMAQKGYAHLAGPSKLLLLSGTTFVTISGILLVSWVSGLPVGDNVPVTAGSVCIAGIFCLVFGLRSIGKSDNK